MSFLLGTVLLLAIVASAAATSSPAPVVFVVSNTSLPTLSGTTDPIYHIWTAASVITTVQLVTLLVIIFRTRAKRTVVTQKF